MKAVYKYTFFLDDIQRLKMPVGAKILSVQVQGNTPCIWAEVETTNALQERAFVIKGTGHEIKERDLRYIGTFQMPPFVWHLYEVINVLHMNLEKANI